MNTTRLGLIILTVLGISNPANAQPHGTTMTPEDRSACSHVYTWGPDIATLPSRFREVANRFRGLHRQNQPNLPDSPVTWADQDLLQTADQLMRSAGQTEMAIHAQFDGSGVGNRAYDHLRTTLGQSHRSRLGNQNKIPVFTGMIHPNSYGQVADGLDEAAIAWSQLHEALPGAEQAIQQECQRLAELEASAAENARDTRQGEAAAGSATIRLPHTTANTADDGDEASADTSVATATEESAPAQGPPVSPPRPAPAAPNSDERLRAQAERQFEEDQRRAQAARNRRADDEAKLAAMQAERDRTAHESAERIAESVASLDSDGQETLALLLAGATAGLVTHGAISGNVDYIQISSGVVLFGSAFGNLLMMTQLGDARAQDTTALEWAVGKDPWYGPPVTLRLGSGAALPTLDTSDLRSVQPLDGGPYPGFISGMTARIFPVRVSVEAARHSGSFTPIDGEDALDSVAWGLSAGVGAQLFSGGLLSPWAEYRVSTLPNCRDNGWMITEDVIDCSGSDVYMVGAGGGAYQTHWVVGNTISLRPLFATGESGELNRTSLFLEISYQLESPSGTGPRIQLGAEFCAGCK